jgi:hypothetical protein
MIISSRDIKAAVEAIRQHSDIEATVEEGTFYVQGTPQVLAEFELCLALELAKPLVGERELQPVRIRNYFVDLLEHRHEALPSGSVDERQWLYQIDVTDELRAHEVISL